MKVTIKERKSDEKTCNTLEVGEFGLCTRFFVDSENSKAMFGTIVLKTENGAQIIYSPEFPHLIGTEFSNTSYYFTVVTPEEFIFSE